MDFHQLESFIQVVDCNSFSTAAKKLYISQPTISSHIQSLEKELGTCLFQRTTKNIMVTEAGYRLYDYAHHIRSLHDGILKEFTQKQSNVLNIGASTINSAYVLPEILASYSKDNKLLSFKIWQAGSLQIINGLLEGSLDIGLVGTMLEDSRCEYTCFYQDEIVLATPATEYFHSLKKLADPLPELLNQPMIVRDHNSGTLKEVEQFMQRQGLHPSSFKIIAHMNDQEAIRNSIVNGLGISFISNKAVEDLVLSGRILTFPLTSTGVFRNHYIVTSRSKIYSEPVECFIKFIKTYYQKMSL